MVNLIVAVNNNNVIGNKGLIPWRCKEDLKLFKETTTSHVVVMGRKTWGSIGERVLRNRVNIVISSDHKRLSKLSKQEKLKQHSVESNSLMDYPDRVFDTKMDDPGPYFQPDFECALVLAKNTASIIKKDVFIIGGSYVYEQALNSKCIDKMYISRIKNNEDGDSKFTFNDKQFSLEKISYYDGFSLEEWRYVRCA
jgi:dihydrofolate reductase